MTEPIISSLPLWILLLPLIGFLLNGVAYPLAAKGIRHTHAGVSGSIATLVMLFSFLLACRGFAAISGEASVLATGAFHWIDIPGMQMAVSLRIDRLSSLMTMIITGV